MKNKKLISVVPDIWKEGFSVKHEDVFSTYAYYLSAVSAGYILDRYKKVKLLDFKLEFYDPESEIPYTEREIKRGPEDSALFLFRCPLEDCLDGGYNLNNLVYQMLMDERVILRGEIACSGRHYMAEGKGPCGGKLRYQIKAVYEERNRGFLDWLRGAN